MDLFKPVILASCLLLKSSIIKKTLTVELKMEIKILLVFVGIVGIAYILYKIVMKKIGQWDPK